MNIYEQVREAIRNEEYSLARSLIVANNFSQEELASFVLSAAGKNATDLLQFLLDSGAPVESKTTYASQQDGLTPLLLATWEGHVESVKILLQGGATVDASQDQQTSLNWAIQRNHVEIAMLLIEHGADVNWQDKPERNCASVLHAAVFQDNEEIAKLLLDNGADLSLKNSLGMTPLEQAKAQNRERIRQLIELAESKRTK